MALNFIPRSFSSSRACGSSQGPICGPRCESLPTASSAPGITWACMSTSIGGLLSARGDAGHGWAGGIQIRADANMNGVTVGQRLDRRLGVGQLVLAAVHLLERETTR